MTTARVKRAVLLGLAAAALANGGCLLVAAGAGAGAAGAAGYAYVKGQQEHEYTAGLDDAYAAVRTALLELHFPILAESRQPGRSRIESRTADGAPVVINLESAASRVPAPGPATRVSIRVGTFGDETASGRIFDQAGLHLVPQGTATAAAPPPALVPAAAPVPETAPPPLAAAPEATWAAARDEPRLSPVPPPR
jgi:hypothetical protein